MKIKNTSGLDLIVPWLGGRLVMAGQVVDVPEGDVWAYTQQSGWAPADDEAQAVHDAADPASQLAEMKVSELQKYATDHDIELDGATKKADIVAAIQAATEKKD